MATLPIDVAGSDEQVDEIQIETQDYTDYELLTVGTYTSPSRTVTAERRVDKNEKPFVMARLEFSELINDEGLHLFLRKPLVKYIFSFTRKQKNRQGETSEIAEYLRAAGITLGGNVNPATLQEALSESGQYPVKVRVDWTNRTPKVGDDYLPEKAYTSDFRTGENGSATFRSKLSQDDINAMPEKAQARLNQVVYNGFVQAKHKVGAFYRA